MSRHLRDLKKMLDKATYEDSYGVHGSDFTVCRICERESGAGMLRKPNWHASDCPVPRLQKKYQRGQH
jgi:hypothetical protein